ncbi:uncharacterized protein LOC117145764 [Drosophila mauritiana]|uniref:Uncharacterized protein LOC117145764 n=1 Tax=Drosophila mauritiana TaxID=7226 RepID=A0A6P8KW44_DROMA|nr:uncharacterized protein LOC117145764 [Drosophila mauritiana]
MKTELTSIAPIMGRTLADGLPDGVMASCCRPAEVLALISKNGQLAERCSRPKLCQRARNSNSLRSNWPLLFKNYTTFQDTVDQANHQTELRSKWLDSYYRRRISPCYNLRLNMYK